MVLIPYIVSLYLGILINVLKYTGIKVQTLQDKDLTLLLKNIIRDGISSVMGDR